MVAEEQFGLLDLGVRVYGLGFGDYRLGYVSGSVYMCLCVARHSSSRAQMSKFKMAISLNPKPKACLQDGFTYEQEAIEEALQRRSRSPKTNAEMGNKAGVAWVGADLFDHACLAFQDMAAVGGSDCFAPLLPIPLE